MTAWSNILMGIFYQYLRGEARCPFCSRTRGAFRVHTTAPIHSHGWRPNRNCAGLSYAVEVSGDWQARRATAFRIVSEPGPRYCRAALHAGNHLRHVVPTQKDVDDDG